MRIIGGLFGAPRFLEVNMAAKAVPPAPELSNFDLLDIKHEGRTFRMQRDMSVEQDLFVMDLVEKMGLDEATLNSLTDPENTSRERAAKKVILEAYRSGLLFQLIGTVMNEDGVEWSPEVTEENAYYLSHITDRGAKEKIHRNLVFLILAFFTYGLPSSVTSQSFSTESGSGNLPSSSDEEPLIWENGSPSSEPSPRRRKKSGKR